MKFARITVITAATAGMILLAGCSSVAGGSGAGGNSNSYPERRISIIVPVPAGSSTDLSTRIVASCLEGELGQTIIVENREGGSGAVGNGAFARAKADGYTLVSTTAANAVLPPILEGDVGYDLDSFQPVATIGQAPVVLLVPAGSKYSSAEEFFEDAQSDRVLVGIPGATSVPAISITALIEQHDLEIEPVAFDGNQGTVQALLGGEVEAAYVSADGGVTLPRIASGEVVALATAVTEPVPNLPDVPTLESLGYSDLPYGDSFWFLATQPGTPDDVIDVLETAAADCMTEEDVREQLGEGVAPADFIGGDQTLQALRAASEDYEAALK